MPAWSVPLQTHARLRAPSDASWYFVATTRPFASEIVQVTVAGTASWALRRVDGAYASRSCEKNSAFDASTFEKRPEHGDRHRDLGAGVAGRTMAARVMTY